MNFLVKTFLLCGLIFNINSNAHSDNFVKTIHNIHNNILHIIADNNSINNEEECYRAILPEYTKLDANSRSNYNRQFTLFALDKCRQYYYTLSDAYDKIFQLDYTFDTQLLYNGILPQIKSSQHYLQISQEDLNKLNKNLENSNSTINNNECIFSNYMEFATFLFCLRDKLNNLYRNASYSNIASICEDYGNIIKTLHSIINYNKIYNDYKIEKHTDAEISFNDFGTATNFCDINRKFSRIQNVNILLQAYVKEYQQSINEIVNNQSKVKTLSKNFCINYFAKYHYFIIRTINTILYLYSTNSEIRSDKNYQPNRNDYENYQNFVRNTMSRASLINTHKSLSYYISVSRDYLTRLYYDSKDDCIYCGSTFDIDNIKNKVLHDTCTMCIRYNNFQELIHHIKKLSELFNPSNTKFSVIKDDNYDEKLFKITNKTYNTLQDLVKY